MPNPDDTICTTTIPPLLSSFADTFVDFSVSGGLFLPPPQPPPQPQTRTHTPSPARLVAIGDIHGDLDKFKQSLLLAGLIDSSLNWSGSSSSSSTTLVQVGDVLDRGGDEIKILYFLERLKRQAAKSGGEVVTMNGNHEIMNVDCDFRYVTKEGLEEFQTWAFWYKIGNNIKNIGRGSINDPFEEGIPPRFRGIRKEFQEGFRARIAALRPGGPISRRFLSENATVVVMGENVFVHGGLLVNHVVYGLERINEEVRDWISGKRGRISREIGRGRDSVVWLRRYSEGDCDCEMLQRVLGMIPGAKRMVMGHTIQESGINGVCGNAAIRIDVGMSRGCGDGLAEVLEISRSSGLRVLTSNPFYKEKTEAAGEGKVGLGLLLPEERPKQVEVRA